MRHLFKYLKAPKALLFTSHLHGHTASDTRRGLPITQIGMTLLEAAISLALLGIILVPLTQWLQAESRIRADRASEAERTMALEALEGFILAHQRVPCPAMEANGHEAHNGLGSCVTALGKLPASSLGLPARFDGWNYAVATLQQLGHPASYMLQRPWMSQPLPITLRDEIILKPVSPSSGLDDTALPAIHLCHHQPGATLPPPQNRGCGPLNLLSPTGVAIILPPGKGLVFTANQGRTHQFVISPNWDPENPVWVTYERFRWLLRHH